MIVGMTGMGGGALMTPLLISYVGLSPAVAVSSDIIYGAITKIFGSIQHLRQGTVDRELVKRLAVGSIPGAIVGSGLAAILKASGIDFNSFVKQALGIALCIIATLLLVSFLFNVNSVKQRIHTWIHAEQYPRLWLGLVGALGGFTVGLTSVGSGTIMMACVLVISNTSLRKLVGSDIVHAVLLLWTASITHIFVGEIQWSVVAWLLVGSIPGIVIGSRLSARAPKQLIKLLMVGLLLFFGIKMLK